MTSRVMFGPNIQLKAATGGIKKHFVSKKDEVAKNNSSIVFAIAAYATPIITGKPAGDTLRN